MLECGSRPSDSEPKGSLDAYSSMQYQMIMGRREDAFSVGGFWVIMYGRIWVITEGGMIAFEIFQG